MAMAVERFNYIPSGTWCRQPDYALAYFLALGVIKLVSTGS